MKNYVDSHYCALWHWHSIIHDNGVLCVSGGILEDIENCNTRRVLATEIAVLCVDSIYLADEKYK